MDSHLLDAVKRGDIMMVNCLVSHGADVNAPYELTLPLVTAADRRNTRMCLALANHGASLDRVVADPWSPCFGHTPLSLAVCCGLKNSVSHLVMFGANVNVKIDWSICTYNPLHVPSKSSLLHAAVARGDRAIIDSLLQAGCRLNTVSTEGNTPLLLACRRTDPGIAEHLIVATKICEEKLNLDAVNRLTGKTSLLEAVARSYISLARSLLTAGCDVNLRTCGGMTALHFAVTLRREVMLCDVLLPVTGCDVNVRDDAGLTPLHVAVTYRDPLFAELLLDAGADYDARSSNGLGPLHFAARGDHCCVIELLVGRGADVNSATPEGETPLMSAVERGNIDACRTLLSCGATLDGCPGKDSALVCSVYGRSEDISALLIASGASVILSHSSPEPTIRTMIVTEQRRTLELLVAAGLSYSKQDTATAPPSGESGDIVSWLDSLLETPKSLKELSRLVIRTTLSDHAQGRAVVSLVDMLGFPAVLSRYLLLDVDNMCLTGLKLY